MDNMRAASAIVKYSVVKKSNVNDGEITLINYSPWLNDRFGGWLGIIVVTTVVIAVAEALGELLVAFGSDRVGIRLFVNVCYLGTIVGYLLLPFSRPCLPKMPPA